MRKECLKGWTDHPSPLNIEEAAGFWTFLSESTCRRSDFYEVEFGNASISAHLRWQYPSEMRTSILKPLTASYRRFLERDIKPLPRYLKRVTSQF